jgi:hypothetical protein
MAILASGVYRLRMRVSSLWLLAGSLAAFGLAVLGASLRSAPLYQEPMPFREYPSFEGSDADAPLPDESWRIR